MLREQSYVNLPDLTPETCKDLCSGYKYFGLETGNQCFCGDDLSYKDELDELKCNSRCTGISNAIMTVGGRWLYFVPLFCILGNSGIACGGSWRLNLYERKLQPGEIFEFSTTHFNDRKIFG